MSKNKVETPLIVEDFPEGYTGYRFLSLIEYDGENILIILDNIHNNVMYGYVIEKCKYYNLDEGKLVGAAAHWYGNGASSPSMPFSIYLAINDLNTEFSPIYKAFRVRGITRIIGEIEVFDLSKIYRRSRRKCKTYKKCSERISKLKNTR